MAKRWRLAAVAVLVGAALVCGSLALTLAPAGAGSSSPSAGSAVGTAVWSPRRVPAVLVDPLNAARERQASVALGQRLAAELARFGAGCALVTRGSSVLTATNADAPLIPASTQKLLVATAALTTLGADFRFRTQAVGTTTGAALDRVWLVGSGDPMLDSARYSADEFTTPLEALADSIVARGVRRIGSVVADDSHFDPVRIVPSWEPTYYQRNFDVGFLSALTMAHGVILVGGRPVTIEDPPRFVAAELTRLLRARGVEVGEPTSGVAPPDAVTVGSVASQPLRTIVAWMLARSDNLAAEMLTKELGATQRHDASTGAGVAAIRDALERLGVSMAGAQQVDGSGLDRGNRMTCRVLADVVALGDRPGLEVLREVLPGGARVAAEPAVRVKGGYLTDVTGVAGAVERTPRLRFAVLLNGGVPKAANAELRPFVDAVLSYTPPVPVPDALVPDPIAPRHEFGH